MNISTIKAAGLANIKKSFGTAFAVVLLNNLIIGAINYLSNNVLGIFSIAIFLVSVPLEIGMYTFFSNLLSNGGTVKDLFSSFKKSYGEQVALAFLETFYIILWSLLLIVPGIIKAFSYSAASYIQYKNPGKSANDCITLSRQVMNGNKGKLFLLMLSFIGWSLLAAIIPGFLTYFFATPTTLTYLGYTFNTYTINAWQSAIVSLSSLVCSSLVATYFNSSKTIFMKDIYDSSFQSQTFYNAGGFTQDTANPINSGEDYKEPKIDDLDKENE